MTDRTPWPMVQNGPIPERDWDDDDRIMVFGPDKGVGLVPTGGTQIADNALGPGSVARSVEGRSVDRISVRDYGAVGDGIACSSGSVSSSATTLTVSDASFVSADVGKTVIIQGAGAAGADLNTTIATVTSATVVEIAVAASTTVSAVPITYGTNDAPAIKAMLDYAVSQASGKRTYISHNSTSIAGTTTQVNGPEVYFPAGTYVWGDTTGWTRSGGAKVLHVVGAGKAATRIEMGGVDAYFLTTGDFIYGRFSDMTLIGGKGFYRNNSTSASVYRGMVFERLGIWRFSECGLGRLSSDNPNWRINDVDFQPATTNAAIGVALAGNADETVIENCTFAYCKYGVKAGKSGNNLKIINNFFTRSQSGGAGIWVVPHTSLTSGGQGFHAYSNKFGNELAVAGGYQILVADEGSGTDFMSKPHATTLSTGFWAGATLTSNLHVGASGAAPAMIYSYTGAISGLLVDTPYIYGSYPRYVIEYDAAVTALTGSGAIRNNLIRTPNVDQIGTNNTSSFQVSNLAGAAYLVDPLGIFSETLEYLSPFPVGYPSDYTSILTSTGAALTAGGNSVSGYTTPQNIAGGEWTFASGSSTVTTGNMNSGATDGRRIFVAFELQAAASQALSEVVVTLQRNDSSKVSEWRRTIKVPTNSTIYQFHTVIASKGSDAIRMVFAPVNYSAGVTDKIRIGFVHSYHAQHPVPQGHRQVFGPNAGAYNGAHWLNGSYHFWMNGAAPRYHSAAPSAATDGLPMAPIFIGTVTWSGSGATTTATVTGAATTDLVYATIKTKPTQAAYLVRALISSTNTLTLELSAANTSNDAVISYMVFRP